MFLAVALIPMVGAVGLAIDSSIGYLLKTRMGKALDTAGLAAGRVALDANAEEVAQQFFDANFGKSNASVTVEPASSSSSTTTFRFVTLSTRATTPTLFMRVFGHDTMTVSARSVIQRETTGMELALVMDNTGSMWGSGTDQHAGTPFEAMRTPPSTWSTSSTATRTRSTTSGSASCPYVADGQHRHQPDRLAARRGDRVLTNPRELPSRPHGRRLEGLRDGARLSRTTATTRRPSAQPFTSFFYATSTTATTTGRRSTTRLQRHATRRRKGPNLGCGTPITPLTASKATIKAGDQRDAALAARRHHRQPRAGLGLAHALAAAGAASGAANADLPLDYDTDFMEKVVVILTDGNNEFYDLTDTRTTIRRRPSDFTAYGRVNAPGPVGLNKTTTGAGVTVLNTRMAETCAAMKAGRQAEGPDLLDHLRLRHSGRHDPRSLSGNCATTPAMYYYAPDNASLRAAFKAIGGQLANLRIVE